MIDIGANLAGNVFIGDLDAVLHRAKQAGLRGIIITGSDEASCNAAIDICQRHSPVSLYATAGIHPHHASNYNETLEKQLKLWLQQSCVVAVGETGLDFNRNYSPPAEQERAFERQLALAGDIGKPLFLHERDAHPRFIQLCNAYRDNIADAVVHCFTGSREALYAYLDAGFYIGITGWVCDTKRGQDLKALLPQIPLGRLMIETDAPYLIPGNKQLRKRLARSGRNEPWTLPLVATTVAEAYGLPIERIIETTLRNSQAFFRLPA